MTPLALLRFLRRLPEQSLQDVCDASRTFRCAYRQPEPPPPFVAVLAFATLLDSFVEDVPQRVRYPLGGDPLGGGGWYSREEPRPTRIRPVTFGKAGPVPPEGRVFELRPTRPLRDVQVIVFCDLSRVSVSGIFCGTNLMTADIGEQPIAYIPSVDPGVLVRVQVERRG